METKKGTALRWVFAVLFLFILGGLVVFVVKDQQKRMVHLPREGREMEKYVFQEGELDDLALPQYVDKSHKPNPYMGSPLELAKSEQETRIEGITGIVLARYEIPSTRESTRNAEIEHFVFRFKDQKTLWKFLLYYNWGDMPLRQVFFIKGNLLSTFSVRRLDSEHQKLIFNNALDSYMNRLEVEEVLYDGKRMTKEEFEKEAQF